jgi:hypothetical protein
LVLFNPFLLLDGPLAKRCLNDDVALGRRISPLLGTDTTLPPSFLLYGSEVCLAGWPSRTSPSRRPRKDAR